MAADEAKGPRMIDAAAGSLCAQRRRPHRLQAFGAEAPGLLVFSSGMLPIDSMADEPMLARLHERLASYNRVVRFDMRGIGMSDPLTPSSPPTLEQWASDAVAVLDAAGLERVWLFAPRDGSLLGVFLAASHPGRVANLVVVNGSPRAGRADDYPAGIPRRLLDRFLDVNFEPDAVERGLDFLAFAAPTVAGDESFRAWWTRAGYRGASPATARAVNEVLFGADVRALLPLVRAPTLVLHRRDTETFRPGHGRYIAEHVPAAKYVELDGVDDLYWVGNTEQMHEEIEEFLTGARHSAPADRVLATVLFTDIVESTRRAAEIGDRRWGELLDRHDAAVRRQLDRFRGRQIKTTGDGVLATFDGPARAVTCACAVRDAAAQLGLDIRAGIHTGEVELRGDDIAGMAVNIAARIEALAAPRQVLVSRTVVDLMVGSGIETAGAGEHSLKGVPGSWQLFAVASGSYA
jgi:class 3 adenylate cyclase